MITLPRLLKIALPVTTVATATIITVSLICLYRNEDKDKKDLNNELLNDFQENLKPFQEKTISYPEEPKEKADEGEGQGGEAGSKEIDLNGQNRVILNAEVSSKGGGGANLNKEEDAGGTGGEVPNLEGVSDIPQVSSGEEGDGLSTIQEAGASASSSADSELEESSVGGAETEDGLSGDFQETSTQGDANEAEGLNQQSTPKAEIENQLGSSMQEEATLPQANPQGPSQPGVEAAEPEDVAETNVEGVHTTGSGKPQDGLDPHSKSTEETKDLAKQLAELQELGVEFSSSSLKLSEALLL